VDAARYEIRTGKEAGSNVLRYRGLRTFRGVGALTDIEADALVAKHPDVVDLRKGETMATATPATEKAKKPRKARAPRFEALTKSLGRLSTTELIFVRDQALSMLGKRKDDLAAQLKALSE
jgi:hypothetical protein